MTYISMVDRDRPLLFAIQYDNQGIGATRFHSRVIFQSSLRVDKQREGGSVKRPNNKC